MTEDAPTPITAEVAHEVISQTRLMRFLERGPVATLAVGEFYLDGDRVEIGIEEGESDPLFGKTLRMHGADSETIREIGIVLDSLPEVANLLDIQVRENFARVRVFEVRERERTLQATA